MNGSICTASIGTSTPTNWNAVVRDSDTPIRIAPDTIHPKRNYGMDVLNSIGSHVRLVHVNNVFRLARQDLPNYE